MKKILTQRERLEIPEKILRPIALFHKNEKRRHAIDGKRRELGFKSDKSERKQVHRVQGEWKGQVVPDGAATSQGEEQPEDYLGKVSSLDIMHNIEAEFREERFRVLGLLRMPADFLAGRQVILIHSKAYTLIRTADSRPKKQQSKPTALEDSHTKTSGYRHRNRGTECHNHLSLL